MDAEPSEETRSSVKDTIFYGSIFAAITVVLLLPGFFYPPYFKAFKTLILVLIGLDFSRMLLAGAFAFRKNDIPEEGYKPNVSIIIPAYNEGNVLRETVEACVNLDYPKDKYEVVISYEGDSTDNTPELAEALADEFDIVKALKSENPGGKAKAVNFALDHVDSEIIAGIDADHQFEEGALKRAVRWFADEDVWCVRGRCYGRNPSGSILSLHATIERHLIERIDVYGTYHFGGFSYYGGGQFFFRSKVFDEIGELGEDILIEDIDMSAKIHKHGKELVIDPEIVTYEQHPEEFANWWSQRVRWTRGWFQVAKRHLTDIIRSKNMSFRKRLDASFIMSYSMAPPLLFMLVPLLAISTFLNYDTSPYVLKEAVIFGMTGVANLAMISMLFLKDRMDGRKHHKKEYLSVLTLGYYYLLGGFVAVKAFIDEFILSKENKFVVTKKHDS
ncbi:MAG: glycosyltransferase family 2 protein [Candidatus Nanohalobium sp.]